MRRENMTSSYVFIAPWDIRPPGGVNNVVVNLFKQIAERGPYRPILFLSSWDHSDLTEKVVDGRLTILYRLRTPWREQARLKSGLAFALYLPATLIGLIRFLRKSKSCACIVAS
jgi:hypothetical protein